jgi:hypothetical protein
MYVNKRNKAREHRERMRKQNKEYDSTQTKLQNLGDIQEQSKYCVDPGGSWGLIYEKKNFSKKIP